MRAAAICRRTGRQTEPYMGENQGVKLALPILEIPHASKWARNNLRKGNYTADICVRIR